MMRVSTPQPASTERPETPREKKRKARSVTAILRAAYLRHTRQRLTLEAVKHCLG